MTNPGKRSLYCLMVASGDGFVRFKLTGAFVLSGGCTSEKADKDGMTALMPKADNSSFCEDGGARERE